jgi:hypothetical protein
MPAFYRDRPDTPSPSRCDIYFPLREQKFSSADTVSPHCFSRTPPIFSRPSRDAQARRQRCLSTAASLRRYSIRALRQHVLHMLRFLLNISATATRYFLADFIRYQPSHYTTLRQDGHWCDITFTAHAAM